MIRTNQIYQSNVNRVLYDQRDKVVRLNKHNSYDFISNGYTKLSLIRWYFIFNYLTYWWNTNYNTKANQIIVLFLRIKLICWTHISMIVTKMQWHLCTTPIYLVNYFIIISHCLQSISVSHQVSWILNCKCYVVESSADAVKYSWWLWIY